MLDGGHRNGHDDHGAADVGQHAAQNVDALQFLDGFGKNRGDRNQNDDVVEVVAHPDPQLFQVILQAVHVLFYD
ncbi:hypothetical protein PXW01_15035 [Faecalibacterium taiwanense]|uniref:hypothetical protein n=1 Tax=Faecalibacterium taiwanense TaxID=3030638 RepID=UPI0031FEF2EC